MILLLSISEIAFLGSWKVFVKSAKITTNERNVDAFVCCLELKKPNGPLLLNLHLGGSLTFSQLLVWGPKPALGIAGLFWAIKVV